MHVEFVVPGPPVSNQSSNAVQLAAWKAKVKAAAKKAWTRSPLAGKLKAFLLNFHAGDKAPMDVDNMSKPIHDAMTGVVYGDDRQIRQAELVHLRIDTPLVVVGAARILVEAIREGKQFVYVRIEDAVEPYPLPR